MKIKLLILSTFVFATACSKSNHSIYQGLADDEDGVLNAPITDEDNSAEDISAADSPRFVLPDELTTKESDLIKKWHSGQNSKVSFIIADAEEETVVRSYLSQKPRRLASVTKVPTSISALENVNDISVDKVKAMLKSSNNSEASRYLRLAAKAIKNYVVAGSAYTTPHSCPSSTVLQKEYPGAAIILDWMKSKVDVDWNGSALKDGAGCDYGNFMSSLQMANILRFADSKGKAYNGLSYEQLLSISGVDGTWAGRNTDAKGMVLAKTGTLSANSNLAGYFYAKRGGKQHKYYFTVFIEKKSSENISNARALAENLVRYWINYYAIDKGTSLGNL